MKLIKKNLMKVKSRFEIGKKAEALALAYLRNDLNSDVTVSSGKFEGCDYLLKFKGKIQKVEVKSCSNYGRFMIHYSQYKALRIIKSSNIGVDENLWIFVWFIGPSFLIKKLSPSQLSRIIDETKLTKCMTGYGKIKILSEKEYLESQSKIVNKFTKMYRANGEKLFKVIYKKMGMLYNISPNKIFSDRRAVPCIKISGSKLKKPRKIFDNRGHRSNLL